MDYHADELDTTNSESAGYATNIPGIQKVTFSIDMDMDATANPFDSPPGLTAGFLSNAGATQELKLYLNDTTGPFWDLSNVRVYDGTNTADVKQTQQLTVKGTATGSFVYPTGAF